MDSNHIRIAYTAAQELIALLSSSYGETLKADRPDLITQAEDAIKKYQALYMEDIVTEKAELIPLLNEIAEIKSALKVISPSSLDSIKTLTELENANAKSLQDALLFDPTLFYNKYALNLASPTTQTLVHTPEENERFNLWFGSSKVVDSEGKPLVVYHGTGGLIQDYNEFKFSPFPAAYFAENKSYSEWFATYRGGTNIMHNCYLKVQNPIDITAFGVDLVSYHDFVLYIKLRYGYDLPENIRIKTMADASGGMWAWRYLRNGADWIQYIHRKNDFDGVVYYENNPSDKVEGVDKVTKAWMVFDGSQIKSADIRNTTYSLSSKNIAMKKGGSI